MKRRKWSGGNLGTREQHESEHGGVTSVQQVCGKAVNPVWPAFRGPQRR